MENFFSNKFKILFLLSYILLALYAFIYFKYVGYTLSHDSENYHKYGKFLAENFFILFSIKDIPVEFPFPFYYFNGFYYGVYYFFFVDDWKIYFFIFNLVLIFLTAYTSQYILKKLGINNYIISIVPLFFILSPDYFLWTRYILMENIKNLLIVITLLYLIALDKKKEIDFKSTIQAILFFIFIFLFNANLQPLALYLLLFLFFKKLNFNIYNLFNLIVFLSPLIFIFLFNEMSNPFLNQLKDIHALNFIFEWNLKGVVIHDRPSTFLHNEGTIHFLIKLFFSKIFYFISPYFYEHSNFNNLSKILFYFFFYVLIFLQFIYFSKDNFKIMSVYKMILFLIIFIILYSAFTFIDYDFRYRFKIVPLLIILGSITLNEILIKLKINFAKN